MDDEKKKHGWFVTEMRPGESVFVGEAEIVNVTRFRTELAIRAPKAVKIVKEKSGNQSIQEDT